jgi:hypothetical protein
MNEEYFFNLCMAENPVQVQTVNGIERELDGIERAAVCRAWAKSQIENARVEAVVAATLEARKEPLRRLGLTEEEIGLLLS